MSKIGYIRVSTEHQETARQQEIMCDYQVDRIFSEKLSGANTDRPQLRAILDYVREGDTLYIESISRLECSTMPNRTCVERKKGAPVGYTSELYYTIVIFLNKYPLQFHYEVLVHIS